MESVLKVPRATFGEFFELDSAAAGEGGGRAAPRLGWRSEGGGRGEMAQDEGGLTREAFCCFWDKLPSFAFMQPWCQPRAPRRGGGGSGKAGGGGAVDEGGEAAGMGGEGGYEGDDGVTGGGGLLGLRLVSSEGEALVTLLDDELPPRNDSPCGDGGEESDGSDDADGGGHSGGGSSSAGGGGGGGKKGRREGGGARQHALAQFEALGRVLLW